MKRFAANIILAEGIVHKNAMIQIDDSGVVESITSLSHFNNEPASTPFYNGIITIYPSAIMSYGYQLLEDKLLYIVIGEKVEKLALWKNISIVNPIIIETTELIRL